MVMATITSKGQITIPAVVREEMGAETGSRVEFVPIGNGRYELVVANLPVQKLKGLVKPPALPVSVEDMNSAVVSQTLELSQAEDPQ